MVSAMNLNRWARAMPSPRRGTWPYVAWYCGGLIVALTIVALVLRFDVQYWLGSVIGVAVVAVVLSVQVVINVRRASSR
jgi:hypothetical protein